MDVFPVWAPALAKGGPGASNSVHSPPLATVTKRLDALSRRYPGKLELRAPNGATPIHLRMQAQAASRLDHIEARVTLAAAGATGSRLVSIWDQTRTWDPGD